MIQQAVNGLTIAPLTKSITRQRLRAVVNRLEQLRRVTGMDVNGEGKEEEEAEKSGTVRRLKDGG